MKHDWFGRSFRERIPILIFIIGYMLLYFPINQLNQGKGVPAPRIDIIDGNIPLIPIFVVIYVVAFFAFAILPIWAACLFSRELFQQYILALFAAICIGFTLWVLFPAYMVKAPIMETDFFSELLKLLHAGGENTTGVHNAIPSSHVYYVTVAAIYFIQHDRKFMTPMILFAVLNAVSTMFTHQHYFLDVAAGLIVTWIAHEISLHLLTPFVQDLENSQKLTRIRSKVRRFVKEEFLTR